jgi:lipopolysaccharide/colanic/teichoic acid biosynthesis glycosyltransferase
MKRLIDIILSSIALLVLSPLLIPIMVILKLTGEHYIFYTQPRMGKGGKPFQLLKFATMLLDSPNLGAGDITLKHDPRVLPFGRILRKTKINELPQIINVLKGDMSIVGPRPLTPKQFDCYTDEVKKAINKMTPGLSGIGSIVFRDEEDIISKSSMSPHECYKKIISLYKGELEMWYCRHRSLWIDGLIIFLTIWVILFPKSELHYRILKDLPEKPESLGR